MTQPLPEEAGKRRRRGSASSSSGGSPSPRGRGTYRVSTPQDAPLPTGRPISRLGKLQDLRLSQPLGPDNQGRGGFRAAPRLGHFPKRGSTLRAHPGKPTAPLVQGSGPSGQT